MKTGGTTLFQETSTWFRIYDFVCKSCVSENPRVHHYFPTNICHKKVGLSMAVSLHPATHADTWIFPTNICALALAAIAIKLGLTPKRSTNLRRPTGRLAPAPASFFEAAPVSRSPKSYKSKTQLWLLQYQMFGRFPIDCAPAWNPDSCECPALASKTTKTLKKFERLFLSWKERSVASRHALRGKQQKERSLDDVSKC